MTLQVQFLTIFMMFCGGLLLGILFDFIRVLSGKLRLPRWMLPLADMFYWIVATILVFRLLIYSNEGQVRVFIFLGILIGICFYFGLLSIWVIRLIVLLIRMAVALYRFFVRMIHIVLIKPIVGMYRLIVLFLGFLAALAIFLYKVMIQLLYPLWRLLRWMTRPLGSVTFIRNWLNHLSHFIRRLFRSK